MNVRTWKFAVSAFAAFAFLAAMILSSHAQAQSAKKPKPAESAAHATAEAAKKPAAEAKPAESAPAAAVVVAPVAPAASATPAGQYKIGVVSRKVVLEKYTKVKAEYEKLQAKVSGEQKEIDDLSKKIDAAKKDYDANKASMAETDRATKEAEIQKDYSQYRFLLETKQREIDAEEQRLMKTVLSEVDTVVDKIASQEGYHLVFESGARGGVIYSSPTIDITQKVVDALNAGK